MSNEIVPAGQAGPLEVPDYAKKYLANKEGYAGDVGDITVGDIGLNFLKMVQGLSKEAKPGWNGPGSQPLPQGTVVLSRDHAIFPIGTIIVPLLRKTKYIKWEGRPGDGQMLAQCESANDPKITKENGLAWRTDADGDPQPPIWTKYINFWFMSQYNQIEPAILSFYRTSETVAKKWTGELMRHTQGWKLPLFLFKYRLLEPKWIHEGANSWPQFNLVFDGLVNEQKLPHVEKAYKSALYLYQATANQSQVEADAHNAVAAEDDDVIGIAKGLAAEQNTAPPSRSSGLALAQVIQQAEQERDAVQQQPAAPAAPVVPAATPAAAQAAPAQIPPADTFWGG